MQPVLAVRFVFIKAVTLASSCVVTPIKTFHNSTVSVGIRFAFSSGIMNTAPDVRCPQCQRNTVEVVITAALRSYRCVSCEYTWAFPHVRPVRDRRRSPEQA